MPLSAVTMRSPCASLPGVAWNREAPQAVSQPQNAAANATSQSAARSQGASAAPATAARPPSASRRIFAQTRTGTRSSANAQARAHAPPAEVFTRKTNSSMVCEISVSISFMAVPPFAGRRRADGLHSARFRAAAQAISARGIRAYRATRRATAVETPAGKATRMPRSMSALPVARPGARRGAAPGFASVHS